LANVEHCGRISKNLQWAQGTQARTGAEPEENNENDSDILVRDIPILGVFHGH
jgi:hypothetical protein